MIDFMLKSGLAEAVDSTMVSGEWDLSQTIGLGLIFLSPVILPILGIVFIYLCYRLIKWRFRS